MTEWERDRLKKRNEILEADIKRLKEMQKLDKRVTKGAYLDRGKLSYRIFIYYACKTVHTLPHWFAGVKEGII